MIQEVIVTTLSADGVTHLAPMGIHVIDDQHCLIKPFRPSTTLDNLLHSRYAVINCCDDVRIFAGCLTGRRDWPLMPTEKIPGMRLSAALSHMELACDRFSDDAVRPSIHCSTVHTAIHAPFRGFNRAQFAVIEAAILASRLDMLPDDKINSELAYLRIGMDKTAGDRERQAWDWLMALIGRDRPTVITEGSQP